MNKYAACLLALTFFTACNAVSPETQPIQLPAANAAQTSPMLYPSPTVRPTAPSDAYTFAQNRRLGRGINLGNALEAPEEGEWGIRLEEEYFRIIQEGGFNSVRVPIRWNAHAQESAPYTIDEAFFERVDWVLEQALENDLSIILNLHHYDAIMSSPADHKERFLAIWRQIAARYQGAPDSLYFELLNEPNGNISSTGAWNEIAAEGIAAIRETNPTRTLIIGPGEWNSISQLKYLQLPEGDRNIIVTFHFYAPFEFTHQGAEWVQNSNAWLGIQWKGTQAEQAVLLRELDTAARWSEKNGRPLLMGEFGAYSKAGMESRQRWTAFMARSAEERGFSWAYWEFASGFGAYDLNQRKWNDPIYTALMP